MKIKKLPDSCPVCGTKTNLGVYICTVCWADFMRYLEKEHPLHTHALGYGEGEILSCLSEYLELKIGKKVKEKVTFT